jgi:ribosomal protein L11 methyltransferase
VAASHQARLWRITLSVPASRAERAEAALADHLGGTLQSIGRFVEDPAGRWRIEALADAPPDTAAVTSALAKKPGGGPVRDLEIDRLPDTDWVARSLSTHVPVRAGRFSVYGSHIDPPPPGPIKLCIDAGLAFGTGIHPSTRGCLLAIDRLARRRRFAAPLDIGCGTGLLALAMARAFQAPVLATDNDPIAVAEARRNARRNGLDGLARIVRADGLRHRRIRDAAPFDLVTANIFANTLIRLAPHIAAAASPAAAIVLSGILQRQSAAVAAAYRGHGFVLRTHCDLGEWRTLVLRRAGVAN